MPGKQASTSLLMLAKRLGRGESGETLDVLHVQRIGHGISARDDPGLLQLLASRHIPLELCPSSNLCTGVITEIESLSLRDILEQGIAVTINSDDPALFNTSLEREYARVVDAFSLTEGELVAMVESGIAQSFADEETKTQLRQRLQDESRISSGLREG